MEKLIFAIDPGNIQSAYVVFTPYAILEMGKIDNDELIHRVGNTLFEEVVKGFEYIFAIEMIASYGMPVGREVFDTCRFIGRLEQLIYPAQAKLIFRKDIKMHLCNSMKAKDGNIRQALIDRYGSPGTKKAQGFTYGVSADIWSALAIATYVYETSKK